MLETTAVFVAGVVVGAVLASSTSSTSSTDSVTGFLDERRESIRSDFEAGRISHERFASEIELLEDPRTEQVMYSAVDVDGVGPATAFEVAREWRSPDALASASEGQLRAVNGVGDNRARAIHQRVTSET